MFFVDLFQGLLHSQSEQNQLAEMMPVIYNTRLSGWNRTILVHIDSWLEIPNVYNQWSRLIKLMGGGGLAWFTCLSGDRPDAAM